MYQQSRNIKYYTHKLSKFTTQVRYINFEYSDTAVVYMKVYCKFVTAQAKTHTHGFPFERLKTVPLPYVIRSRSIGSHSNGWSYSSRKIFSHLNGCCYPLKKPTHLFKQLRSSVWKKLQPLEWLMLSIRNFLSAKVDTMFV